MVSRFNPVPAHHFFAVLARIVGASHRADDLPEDLIRRATHPGVVVGAGGDDDGQIELGHDEEALPAVAEGGAPPQGLASAGDGARPPLIAVLQPVPGGDVWT